MSWVASRQSSSKKKSRLRSPSYQRLVDGDGSARSLHQSIVGRSLATNSRVLASVLEGNSAADNTDGDLLAVEADSTVKDLVESEAETGKGVLGLLALLLLV